MDGTFFYNYPYSLVLYPCLFLFHEPDVDDEAAASSASIPKDVLITRLTELFGEAVIKELESEDWKVGPALHIQGREV